MKAFKAIKGRAYTNRLGGGTDLYMDGHEKIFLKKADALEFLDNTVGKIYMEIGCRENILQEIEIV